MLKIGLTGGIASGKSAVADELGRLGATVIDTDVIARDVVAPGSAGLAEVVTEFGTAVLTDTGQLDRRALRDRVFADAEQRRRLEELLHPRIRAATVAAMAAATGPYAVVVVPLLVETDFAGLVDRVLVVDCDPAQQIARVMVRDACSAEDAERIIASQIDRASRLAAADDVIRNDGSLADLRRSTAVLHAQYLQRAQSATR